MNRLTLLAIAGLLATGADAVPTFDVSSVKLNTWDDNGLRIEGAPDWIVTERVPSSCQRCRPRDDR